MALFISIKRKGPIRITVSIEYITRTQSRGKLEKNQRKVYLEKQKQG